MYSLLCSLIAIALICVVGAIWLWRSANASQHRLVTERFVDSRIAASAAGAAAAGQATHGAAPSGAIGGARGFAGETRPPASGASGPGAQQGGRVSMVAAPFAVPGGSHGLQAGARVGAQSAARPRAPAHPFVQAVQRVVGPWREGAEHVAHRAGVQDIGRFYLFSGAALLGLTLFAGLNTNLIAALVLLAFMLIALRLWLWHRSTRQQHRIVTQLPSFLDGVVRMITIGNSIPAAFQAAVPIADRPLRDCLERAARMMRAGVELDKALNTLADLYEVEEFMLIASVVRLSVRYGGRADQVLERMAVFIRDREMAQRELVALSAETRLSAWILGLLPVLLGGFIIVMNPGYFLQMWLDPVGRNLYYGAFSLEVIGVFLLYRLASL